jgi:hypothetical protein
MGCGNRKRYIGIGNRQDINMTCEMRLEMHSVSQHNIPDWGRDSFAGKLAFSSRKPGVSNLPILVRQSPTASESYFASPSPALYLFLLSVSDDNHATCVIPRRIPHSLRKPSSAARASPEVKFPNAGKPFRPENLVRRR